MLEANIDDLDPRLWPGVLSALMDAGADDAWLTPILMKKGRPAHTLHVLAGAGGARPRCATGLRPRAHARRARVRRRRSTCSTGPGSRWSVDGRPVRIKLGHRNGRIITATPEFSDVAAVAKASGTTERSVLAGANAAAAAAGLVVGGDVPGPS